MKQFKALNFKNKAMGYRLDFKFFCYIKKKLILFYNIFFKTSYTVNNYFSYFEVSSMLIEMIVIITYQVIVGHIMSNTVKYTHLKHKKQNICVKKEQIIVKFENNFLIY